MEKKPARGGRRNEAAARNGKAVGRPATLDKPKKITVSLDASTIAILQAINSDNLSEAIRTLARQSQKD